MVIFFFYQKTIFLVKASCKGYIRLFVVCGLIHALFSSNIKEENKSGNCGLQFKICELMVNIYFRFILLRFICFGVFFLKIN